MVGVEGFEPPAVGLEIRCSIQLSYTPALAQHDSHAPIGKSNAVFATFRRAGGSANGELG
jgi:hypothetical protein